MDCPGKSLKVTIPVQAPVNSKPEEEDGFTTPKGEEFRIPPQLECPPAPGRNHRETIDKRHTKPAGKKIISFNVQDLDCFFARIHNVAEDS